MANTINYGWVKPIIGADDDVWGNELNTDLDGIDSTVKSVSTVANAALPLIGTTTNDNAAAGQIGEIISSNVTTGVTLSTTVYTNITSINLTAGDWDVYGEIWFSIGTGAATQVAAGINTVSATMPSTSSVGTSFVILNATSLVASAGQTVALRPCRASLATTTTYYLVGRCVFPSGTVTATGNIIARRAR
jgi:hypothetical protein